MENNNEDSCDHESKKRKIDEVTVEQNVDSTEAIIIKQEKDDSTEISAQPSDCDTEEVIEVSEESIEMNGTKSSALGNVRLIPIFQLRSIKNEQNTDDINDGTQEETTGCAVGLGNNWNALIGKIEQLEGNLIEKMGSEISKLKKSWEENNCKCKFVHKKDVDDLTSKIDQLKRENEQQEQQNQLLIKEKTELQQIIDKELAFRSQVSKILNGSTRYPKTENMVKAEPIENNENQNAGEQKLKIPPEVRTETKENSKLQKNVAKKMPVVKNRGILNIPKYIRDKKPRTLSIQYLAGELHEREQRRCNIVMRGMVYSGGNLYHEIVDFLWRATGLQPNIVDIAVMDVSIVLRIASLSNKHALLSRKHMLRGTGVSIFNDLTAREDQVQTWLHEVARDQENIGKRVEVRFLKIKIDGDWWMWSEEKTNLIRDT